MNDEMGLSHFATCKVWSTGGWWNCDCRVPRPWRIRKEPQELFSWRIWRFTPDGYEHFIRCSSFAGALDIISELSRLRLCALEGDGNA